MMPPGPLSCFIEGFALCFVSSHQLFLKLPFQPAVIFTAALSRHFPGVPFRYTCKIPVGKSLKGLKPITGEACLETTHPGNYL
jgi:hypothetical protein